jgi:DNA-binding NtrC family response regulator
MLIGRSASTIGAIRRLEAVAASAAEVLLSGPTGVGKELYARHLHETSGRTGKFVAVNCGAIPGELFENEMFGHVAGAFTGAATRREGLVAHAEQGTLFLDEVHALLPVNQVKLLRLLQEKEYRALGEAKIRIANVRIVSATNVDLTRAATRGEFRQDLFYRLHVVPVKIPPLRERTEDIEPLVEHFAQAFAQRYGGPVIRLGAPAIARMLAYSWPGNVRELENCVHRLTCVGLGRVIEPDDLDLDHDGAVEGELPIDRVLSQAFCRAKAELVASFERRYVAHALARSGGNIASAARLSGKPRRAFFALMRRHGIDPAVFRAKPAGGRHGVGESDEPRLEVRLG